MNENLIREIIVMQTQLNKLVEKLNLQTEMAEQSIDVLALKTRADNVLRTNNIRTLKDLCVLSELEVVFFKNLGKRSISEIREALKRIGLSLGCMK